MELVVYIAAARDACDYLLSFYYAGEKNRILSFNDASYWQKKIDDGEDPLYGMRGPGV